MIESKFYPNVGHIGIVLSLADGFRDKTTVRQDIADFVSRYRY